MLEESQQLALDHVGCTVQIMRAPPHTNPSDPCGRRPCTVQAYSDRSAVVVVLIHTLNLGLLPELLCIVSTQWKRVLP